MSLLFYAGYHAMPEWRAALQAAMPGLEIVAWPDVPDPDAIEYVLTFAPEPGVLRRFANLRVIFSSGAGVDRILADPDLPPGVPVVRMVDERLSGGMAEYVLLHVLRQHRRLDEMQASQRAARWQELPTADTPRTTVGILGLGELGGHAGRLLALLGFRVIGWSRTQKQIPGIESFWGQDQLPAFLGLCRHLVCLLPLTPATTGIIDRRTLAMLPPGAFLINAGRGGHVVEADLLAALDCGQVAAATLDVFQQEPLPPEHPFWRHPKVTVTPHNAADSVAEAVAPQIAENIRRARAGRPLRNVVERSRGY